MENCSLAEFVSQRREKLGFSQSGIAKRANLPLNQIEDIESGKDLFLSSTVRQKLAKALKLTNAEIQKYERNEKTTLSADTNYIKRVKELILNGDAEDVLCPICQSKLETKIETMYDLEDNPVLLAKARCTKCPFQIK